MHRTTETGNRTAIAFLSAVTCAVALGGCAPSAESLLVGSWKPEKNPIPLVDPTVEFRGDRTFSVTLQSLAGTQTVVGDWEYLRAEGEDHLLSVRASETDSFRETSFRMPSADVMEIDLPPLGPVRMVRVPEN